MSPGRALPRQGEAAVVVQVKWSLRRRRKRESREGGEGGEEGGSVEARAAHTATCNLPKIPSQPNNNELGEEGSSLFNSVTTSVRSSRGAMTTGESMEEPVEEPVEERSEEYLNTTPSSSIRVLTANLLTKERVSGKRASERNNSTLPFPHLP